MFLSCYQRPLLSLAIKVALLSKHGLVKFTLCSCFYCFAVRTPLKTPCTKLFNFEVGLHYISFQLKNKSLKLFKQLNIFLNSALTNPLNLYLHTVRNYVSLLFYLNSNCVELLRRSRIFFYVYHS